MRVIAGALKGRTLAGPTWPGLRPTSDRLRETLFDILGERVRLARVLDAYAGTGAVGIEAISRGAAFVMFVDRDPRALALVAANLRRCGITEGYAMMRSVTGLRRQPEMRPFDLVLLDPPYGERDLAAAVTGVGQWLAPDGWLVLEHESRRAPPDAAASLVRTRTVRSGDSALTFYRRPPVTLPVDS